MGGTTQISLFHYLRYLRIDPIDDHPQVCWIHRLVISPDVLGQKHWHDRHVLGSGLQTTWLRQERPSFPLMIFFFFFFGMFKQHHFKKKEFQEHCCLCFSFTVCCRNKSQNSMLSTVWGARRRNTGPMPLYKPMRPSVWQTFSMQSEKPRYRRPWRQIRETDRSVRLSLCQKLSDDIISFDEIISAHPTTLIHRLIVQPGTDDVKGRHGKRHHDSTHHGCDQGREPVVWSEPLMWTGKKKKKTG